MTRIRYVPLWSHEDAYAVFLVGPFDFNLGEVRRGDDGLWTADVRPKRGYQRRGIGGWTSRSAAAAYLAITAGVAEEPERDAPEAAASGLTQRG
jgi:hypothetical protein